MNKIIIFLIIVVFLLVGFKYNYNMKNNNNNNNNDEEVINVNDELKNELQEQKYFIENNLSRYINYYNNNSDLDWKDIVTNVNTNIDNEFYNNDMDTDTSKGILMITNKFYKLTSDFEGLNLVKVSEDDSMYGRTYYLNEEAYEHFKEMVSDARSIGLDFGIYSAYRSYDTQVNLYNNYVKRDGVALADTYSARAGYSEHQTGLAVDLRSRTMNTSYFEETNEYKWLKDNAHKYGFIIRYPEEFVYITGYQFEPWHYRYCGKEAATIIYNEGITFDEYYEYYVK